MALPLNGAALRPRRSLPRRARNRGPGAGTLAPGRLRARPHEARRASVLSSLPPAPPARIRRSRGESPLSGRLHCAPSRGHRALRPPPPVRVTRRRTAVKTADRRHAHCLQGHARETLRCSATAVPRSPPLLDPRSLSAALRAFAPGALSLRSAARSSARLRLARLRTARTPSARRAGRSPPLRYASLRRPFPPSPASGGIHPPFPPPRPCADPSARAAPPLTCRSFPSSHVKGLGHTPRPGSARYTQPSVQTRIAQDEPRAPPAHARPIAPRRRPKSKKRASIAVTLLAAVLRMCTIPGPSRFVLIALPLNGAALRPRRSLLRGPRLPPPLRSGRSPQGPRAVTLAPGRLRARPHEARRASVLSSLPPAPPARIRRSRGESPLSGRLHCAPSRGHRALRPPPPVRVTRRRTAVKTADRRHAHCLQGHARETLRCSATAVPRSPPLLDPRSLSAALRAFAPGALSLRSAVRSRARLRLARLRTARTPSVRRAGRSPPLRSASLRRPFPPSPPATAGGFTPLFLPLTPKRRYGSVRVPAHLELARQDVAAPGLGMPSRFARRHRARRRSARLVPGDPYSLSVTRRARPPLA